MRVPSVIVLLALVSGCVPEPTPLSLTGEQLMVHSLLLAGEDTVQVLLTRTFPPTDATGPDGASRSRPVSGADVRLIVAGAVIQLREAPEGFPPCFAPTPASIQQVDSLLAGCYAAVVPERIQPGQEYRLEVRVGEGLVEGRTAVPERPEIIRPRPRARLAAVFAASRSEHSAFPIPVEWRAPEGVAGIQIGLALDSAFLNGRREPGSRCSVAILDSHIRRTERVDDAVLTVANLHCVRGEDSQTQRFVPDSVFGRVILSGYNSNFVRYQEVVGRNSTTHDRLQVGVTGALGVFAGAGIQSQEVVLISKVGADTR